MHEDSISPDGIERFDTTVDLRGLMAVLSEHLYSTPDVAVRELVQNAHDSLTRRQILSTQNPALSLAEDPLIRVTADESKSLLVVADNGSGLTHHEIHRLLATVGTGGTRELRSETNSEELIGMFGLGFLSAFAVASEVTVTTTSVMKPDETWTYHSFNGFDYTVLPAAPGAIGTTVTLQLKPGFSDLATEVMAASILRRYCRLLSLPITLNGGPPINLDAPWRSPTSTAAELLQFATDFDNLFAPLTAVPIGTPDAELRGQLWIHGGSTYGNADNRNVAVFVRGMLLAENDQDLLPRWAGFASAVVESPTLTPTASRETLQRDANYAEAQVAISEALIVGLSNVARHDPPTWRRILDRHSQALLGAAVTDDRLFDLTADQVVLPSSQGDRTVAALRHGRRIHMSLGADRGFEELLFIASGIPVVRGDRYGVQPFLRTYCSRHNLELVVIGTDDGNSSLFADETLDKDDLDWLQSELAGADEAVHPARFSPEEVPLVVVPDREVELKQRVEDDGLDAAAGSGAAALARLHTADIDDDRAAVRIYVNLACPTVERMLALRSRNPSGATRAAILMATLKTLMAASDRGRGGKADVSAAFANALTVIDSLLLDTSGEPDE